MKNIAFIILFIEFLVVFLSIYSLNSPKLSNINWIIIIIIPIIIFFISITFLSPSSFLSFPSSSSSSPSSSSSSPSSSSSSPSSSSSSPSSSYSSPSSSSSSPSSSSPPSLSSLLQGSVQCPSCQQSLLPARGRHQVDLLWIPQQRCPHFQAHEWITNQDQQIQRRGWRLW